jgi:hypothetical protein
VPDNTRCSSELLFQRKDVLECRPWTTGNDCRSLDANILLNPETDRFRDKTRHSCEVIVPNRRIQRFDILALFLDYALEQGLRITKDLLHLVHHNGAAKASIAVVEGVNPDETRVVEGNGSASFKVVRCLGEHLPGFDSQAGILDLDSLGVRPQVASKDDRLPYPADTAGVGGYTLENRLMGLRDLLKERDNTGILAQPFLGNTDAGQSFRAILLDAL